MMYSPVATISAADLKSRMSSGENLVLLDVRRPEERDDDHISGDTLFIPLHELQSRTGELEQFRGSEIIIYCRSGNRSGQACQFLNQQGFTTVNLAGGMLKWRV